MVARLAVQDAWVFLSRVSLCELLSNEHISYACLALLLFLSLLWLHWQAAKCLGQERHKNVAMHICAAEQVAPSCR
jgi:hypothetical protein